MNDKFLMVCTRCGTDLSGRSSSNRSQEGDLALGLLGLAVAAAGGEIRIKQSGPLQMIPRVRRFDDYSTDEIVLRVLDDVQGMCPVCDGVGKTGVKNPVDECGFDSEGAVYAAYANSNCPGDPCANCDGKGIIEKGDDHDG